jgi:hypothetical protein
MKRLLIITATLLAGLCIGALTVGCAKTASTTTPPAALAPGYSSQADETLGKSLAAVNAFVTQEKVNYAALPAAQQATEKPYLNKLIDATDLANTAYVAFHANTQTLAQAQSAYNAAQTAQTTLQAAVGVQ